MYFENIQSVLIDIDGSGNSDILKNLTAKAKISDELMNHPRFSFNAGENSESTIIEQYIGSTSNSYFINAVTQVNIEKNAKLNHVRIQEDDQMSHHTACTYYTLNKSSILNSTSISSVEVPSLK